MWPPATQAAACTYAHAKHIYTVQTKSTQKSNFIATKQIMRQ